MTLARKSILVILIVLIIDQASKFWIKTNMMLGQEFRVLGRWFIIHFTENNGMAFGMELGGETGKLILSIFRMVAIVGIGWYLAHLIKQRAVPGLIICISLILAGALGNLIDSAIYGILFNDSYYKIAEFLPEGGGYSSFLHGRVVDMLYFPIIRTQFPDWFPIKGGQPFIFFRPVFNVADSAISIGVFFLLIFQKRYFKE